MDELEKEDEEDAIEIIEEEDKETAITIVENKDEIIEVAQEREEVIEVVEKEEEDDEFVEVKDEYDDEEVRLEEENELFEEDLSAKGVEYISWAAVARLRSEPSKKTPNCKQLHATILASAKEKDYGIVRIKPYQTNEEIEAWRWNHSRLLQEHHNIFEDVHEYMKKSGIGLSLNNTSEKEKEKKATGNNGVEEEERNEEVDVHMEWIRIELFVFQIIWHIAKDDKFPDVIQVDENSDVFFFLKSFALDLRCQIEKYFKIFECKEIEIEIPTELNCDNEKK